MKRNEFFKYLGVAVLAPLFPGWLTGKEESKITWHKPFYYGKDHKFILTDGDELKFPKVNPKPTAYAQAEIDRKYAHPNIHFLRDESGILWDFNDWYETTGPLLRSYHSQYCENVKFCYECRAAILDHHPNIKEVPFVAAGSLQMLPIITDPDQFELGENITIDGERKEIRVYQATIGEAFKQFLMEAWREDFIILKRLGKAQLITFQHPIAGYNYGEPLKHEFTGGAIAIGNGKLYLKIHKDWKIYNSIIIYNCELTYV